MNGLHVELHDDGQGFFLACTDNNGEHVWAGHLVVPAHLQSSGSSIAMRVLVETVEDAQ